MVIGIDPGLRGGICKISEGGHLEYYKIPVWSKINLINGPEFLKMLKSLSHEVSKPIIILEDVHSIPGASAKSNFGFGKSVGITELIVRWSGITFEFVQPKTWQEEVWISSDRVKSDTKATSLNAVKRLYPNFDFLATKRSTVPHDGIVDATLIAHYKFKNL